MIEFQSKYKNIFLFPHNIRYYASMMDPTVSIIGRYIHVAAGTANQQLLTVPIARPGEVTVDTVIKVTVAFKLRSGDNDPIIGLTDGTASMNFT